MSDSQRGRAKAERGTGTRTVRGVAPTASKQPSRADRLERAAEGAQSGRGEIVAEFLLAQEQLAEWGKLHHLLHEVLTASAPFYAGLAAVSGCDQLQPPERHALHMNWRPCRERISALANFCEGIKHIGRPFERDAQELRGARCAVDIVAVQVMLEDALTDERPHTQALVELADDFRTACHRHLAVADREMQVHIDLLRRASAVLFGGLS